MSKKVFVSYGRTVSANYQSKKYEFGFEFLAKTAKDVVEATTLCEWVVNYKLTGKAGGMRKRADVLAKKFFNCTFDELLGRDEEGV